MSKYPSRKNKKFKFKYDLNQSSYFPKRSFNGTGTNYIKFNFIFTFLKYGNQIKQKDPISPEGKKTKTIGRKDGNARFLMNM